MPLGHTEDFLVAIASINAVAWVAFRLDKAAATAGRWRLSERLLLTVALLGGLGALLGMYAHRRRHKTRKLRFVAIAWLAAAAQLAILGAALARVMP